jgi:para-aminobenzoate synthetase / 4-amino-4-deoxychorismate lyase
MFSCDPEIVRANLLDESRKCTGSCMRVRLTLAKDGTIVISSGKCDEPTHYRLPENPGVRGMKMPLISFSATRTDAQLSWFYHKTTRRDLYDREFTVARKNGLFDICFCNTENEVTEGCITNLILYKNGSYSTPPIRCGLLAGVMRDKLLHDCERPLSEKVISIGDVRTADALFLCNSVRGVVQVRLMES